MPERAPQTNEHYEAKSHVGIEHSIKLPRKEHAESIAEHEARRGVEKALKEAAFEAQSFKEDQVNESPPETVWDAILHDRKRSYKQTMHQIQGKMSLYEKAVSKLIHNPALEKVSQTLGSTIARPDAILFGSIAAFLGVLGVYSLARYNGFALSGFEMIAAFIIGWAAGILFDFLRTMITGKR